VGARTGKNGGRRQNAEPSGSSSGSVMAVALRLAAAALATELGAPNLALQSALTWGQDG